MSSRLLKNIAAAFAFALAVTGIVAPAASAVDVYAGDSIRVKFANGLQINCTLNSVAYRDGALWGVTAGHCLEPHGAPPIQVAVHNGRVPIASDLRGHGVELHTPPGLFTPFSDRSYFRLDPGVNYVPTARGGNVTIPYLGGQTAATTSSRAVQPPRQVGERWPVTAVKPGTIVCKDGGTSARTCGPVIRVNAQTGELFALVFAIPGDSGSPVYTAGRDGRIHIIGVAASTFSPFLLAVDAAVPLPGGLHG